jgi:hypothetical protein
MALNIEGQFTAVLDTQAKEVLIYDPRFTGEAPRGARRQDQWTADGQFITSILTGTAVQNGDNPWNMVGHIDHWSMNAGQFRFLRTWIKGFLADGKFPVGDGTSFINNRWAYTGPAGYRVRERGDTYSVMSYTAHSERVVGTFGMDLSREDAYALATTLANGR